MKKKAIQQKLTGISKDLTKAEKRILRAILNVEDPNMPVTQLCKKAKVSREKYYQCLRNEKFQKTINEICNSILTKTRIHRIAKNVDKVLQGSLGFNKLVFELEGLHKSELLKDIKTPRALAC